MPNTRFRITATDGQTEVQGEKKKDGSRVLLQELMPVLVVFSLLLSKTGKIRIAMSFHKAELFSF